MNKRAHFFIEIYLSHFILKRVDISCVWEVSWKWGQTATYWPKVLLTIAELLPHLGWGCSTVGHWGPQTLSLLLGLTLASCPPTDSNSNWNWPKPSVAPGYIIVLHLPASAVPSLIYTGASLDWRLSQGSIYNNGKPRRTADYPYLNSLWKREIYRTHSPFQWALQLLHNTK